MEEVNKILTNLKKQGSTNTNILKTNTKYSETCIICGKQFEFEAILKDKWDIPKQYFCSDKCKKVYKEQVYQKKLKVMPVKFRDIECDKIELVKQGIKQSLFITGASGVGKTVLMAGVVKELLKDKGNKVKWISYPGFIMELQSMFRKEGENTPFEMAEEVAIYSGTLCIDDIGAEKMTAFVQQITYYIINYREQEMLHTLITSNFNLQQINDQIDSRVSSRIAGMCKIIKLTGRDRRLNKI